MRTVCIFTSQLAVSLKGVERALKSAATIKLIVERYQSVWYKDIEQEASTLNLKLKYKPTKSRDTDFNNKTAPATRIANGITHYKLYKDAVERDEPVLILEHDAYFIGRPPEPIDDGIIQISCTKQQWTAKTLYQCSRANKMKKHEPLRYYDHNWDKKTGVIEHPLSGMNATAGYIVGPKAASKMVEYIQADGVGFADRVRTAHIGEGNLYLQVPQSVVCDHYIDSIGEINAR